MVGFFAITIANYAQVALGQRPLTLIFYATMALMIKMKEFDDQPSKPISQTPKSHSGYEKVSSAGVSV